METGSVNQAEPLCTYCHGDEEVECDHCTDYFTSCEECGAFGIPVDASGMAPDLCPQCDNSSGVDYH